MKDAVSATLLVAYLLGDLATTAYLIFFDGTNYNWWNWIILIPIDIFLGTIWPIYWLLTWLLY